MSRSQLIATGIVCATALLVTGMVTRTNGGDLNPPGGSVGSTMHTLDEIYDAIGNGQCVNPVPGPPSSFAGQSFTLLLDQTPAMPIAPGQGGVLHTLILGHNTVCSVSDGNGNVIGCFFSSRSSEADVYHAAEAIPLNVRFSNGLSVKAASYGTGDRSGWTIRYTLDP